MGECYIINAPWVFYALWKGLAPLMSPNTVKKVKVKARAIVRVTCCFFHDPRRRVDSRPFLDSRTRDERILGGPGPLDRPRCCQRDVCSLLLLNGVTYGEVWKAVRCVSASCAKRFCPFVL